MFCLTRVVTSFRPFTSVYISSCVFSVDRCRNRKGTTRTVRKMKRKDPVNVTHPGKRPDPFVLHRKSSSWSDVRFLLYLLERFTNRRQRGSEERGEGCGPERTEGERGWGRERGRVEGFDLIFGSRKLDTSKSRIREVSERQSHRSSLDPTSQFKLRVCVVLFEKHIQIG